MELFRPYLLGLVFVGVVGMIATFKVELPVKLEKYGRHYRPQNRYDNNDRSTQASDTLWKETGHAFLEWPGNVTELDYSLPLVAWKWSRAKLVRSPCENKLGMEIALYAQKYLYFTWGSNSLTKWYCDPLRIPIQMLPTATTPKLTIVAVDIGFADDALLVLLEGGAIMRINNFQQVYRNTKTRPQGKLRFDAAQGLTSVVDRIVTQGCCTFGHPYCFYGQSIVAYSVESALNKIFVSKDGGRHFKEVVMQPVPLLRKRIRAVLYYGSHEKMLVHWGDGKRLETTVYNSSSGENWILDSAKKTNITLQGYVQAQRLGNAMSYILWDLCQVWYSDRYLTGEGRKFGLLASNNMLFYGIDSNEKLLRLIGLAADMTLLGKSKRDSVVPGFDRNNRPKLFYPPRYLHFPYPDIIDEKYEKRLGMKIIGKTLFPSDFMSAFHAENLKKSHPSLGLEKCETSTLSVNGSVSQKPKSFTVKPNDTLVLTITFYSKYKKVDQLRESRDWTFLRVEMEVDQRSFISREKFWFKYVIRISYDLSELVIPNAVKLTFYTSRKLRCLYQPEALISIQMTDTAVKESNLSIKQTKPGMEKENQPRSQMIEGTYNHSHTADFIIKTKALGATLAYLILWFSTIHQLVVKTLTRKR